MGKRGMNKEEEEEEELRKGIKYNPRYKKHFTLTTHSHKFSVYTLKEKEEEENEE